MRRKLTPLILANAQPWYVQMKIPTAPIQLPPLFTYTGGSPAPTWLLCHHCRASPSVRSYRHRGVSTSAVTHRADARGPYASTWGFMRSGSFLAGDTGWGLIQGLLQFTSGLMRGQGARQEAGEGRAQAGSQTRGECRLAQRLPEGTSDGSKMAI